MAKTIKAVFGVGECTKVCPQWQYDYNTVLQFVGLDLPANYEVDLSNSKTGQSTTVLGDENGCVIPAQYFIPGSSIFAWVFVTGNDYGFTRAQVEIPISPRAQHTGDPPTPAQQDALDAAIDMLNDAVDALEEAESQIIEHGITPEEREKLAGIEAGAEVNAINEIRYYDPIHDRWEPYPTTNKGVNLPDPVIPERVAVFDFTVDAEDLTVTTDVNPPSIVPIDDVFVSFARVQYDSRVLLLPLTDWQEYPLTLFFSCKISDTEEMSISYDATEDEWIAVVTSFGQQYVDELATDLQEQIGNLPDLHTTDKTSLVGAINELADGGGTAGEDGATFTPSVSAAGVISWTNDKGLPNPTPVNIKGPQGPAYTLTAADKAEIVDDVLAALPTWTGGSY